MQKAKKFSILIVTCLILIAVTALLLWNIQSTSRSTDQVPTVVSAEDAGVVFLDPFLHLQAPLPESFELGASSKKEEWDVSTLVPVGNVDRLPTYNYIIEYRTRKKQRISDISVLLQSLYGTPFSISGRITTLEIKQNLYTSSGSGEQYQAVHFIQQGQDIFIVAKAKDANIQQQYDQAFTDFVQSLAKVKKL